MKVRKSIRKVKGRGNPVLGVRAPLPVMSAFVAKHGGVRGAAAAIRAYMSRAVRP